MKMFLKMPMYVGIADNNLHKEKRHLQSGGHFVSAPMC